MIEIMAKKFCGEIIAPIQRELYHELHTNSKLIEKGDIFIALKGERSNGHDYIEDALKRGATLIIVSEKNRVYPSSVGVLYIGNLAEVVGSLAQWYYNEPEKKLKFIGVTGTNGKTTTTFLIEQLIDEPIVKIGTVEYKVGEKRYEAPNTTPEIVQLTRLFAEAVRQNITWVVMEVSSHALVLNRIGTIEFEVAIFTNLTQDHLDFHLTMDDYFEAKALLFQRLKNPDKGIICIDDEWGQRLFQQYPTSKTYSTQTSRASLYGEIIQESLTGMSVLLFQNHLTYRTTIPFLGEYNLKNIMCALLVMNCLGVRIETLLSKLSILSQISGRFELIENNQEKIVIVDFAHSSDALENILKTIRRLALGKVITVFGCGGDRDRGKRPQMAKVAEEYSDIVIVTSDNPRTESLNQIFNDIKIGFTQEAIFVENRCEAIEKALKIAEKNDAILIAGKGHEQYQIIGKTKYYFSDQESARHFFTLPV